MIQKIIREMLFTVSSAPMKMFKLSEVESVAIEKWGSMEKLTSEQEKRRHQKVTLDNRREEERRHLWDCDKLYGPLQHFMEDIELPMERTSPYFSDKNAESNTGEMKKSLLIIFVINFFVPTVVSLPWPSSFCF